LEQFDWPTTLILFALAFAKCLLPVVAPDHYTKRNRTKWGVLQALRLEKP
jgi:hypothetical protein